MTDIEIAVEAPVLSTGAWRVTQFPPGGAEQAVPDASPPFGVLARLYPGQHILGFEVGYRQSVGTWEIDSLRIGGSSGYLHGHVVLRTAESEKEARPYALLGLGGGLGYGDVRFYPTRWTDGANAAFEAGVGWTMGAAHPYVGVRADCASDFGYWTTRLGLPSGQTYWVWHESNAGIRFVLGLRLPGQRREASL